MTMKKRLLCALITATLMVSPAMAAGDCDQVCGPGVSGGTACAIPWSGKIITCQIWDWFFGFAVTSTASEPIFGSVSAPATCSVGTEWPSETKWFTETSFTVAQ